MEAAVHLPQVATAARVPDLRRVCEVVDAARELGLAAVSANDHLAFHLPWLDGPTLLAAVAERARPLGCWEPRPPAYAFARAPAQVHHASPVDSMRRDIFPRGAAERRRCSTLAVRPPLQTKVARRGGAVRTLTTQVSAEP